MSFDPSYLFILVCLKRGLPRSAPWIKLPGISTALISRQLAMVRLIAGTKVALTLTL